MSEKNAKHLHSRYVQSNDTVTSEEQLNELQKNLNTYIYHPQGLAPVKSKDTFTSIFNQPIIASSADGLSAKEHVSACDINFHLFPMSCDQKHNTQHDEGAIPSSSLSPVIIDTHSLSLQIQQQQYYQQQQQLCMAPSIIPHHHLSEDVSFEENINVVPLSFNSTCSIDNLYSLSPSSSSTTTTDTSMMQTADSQHFCSIEKEEGFMIDDNSLKKDQTQKLKSKKKRRITSDRVSSSKDIQAFNEMSNSELRRQIHIQSEQKRRAQIKDGFEELRNELPSCLNKKMSKVALLHRTVQQIQHLKNNQAIILLEVERLTHENEQLKKFKENAIQNQISGKLYTSLI